MFTLAFGFWDTLCIYMEDCAGRTKQTRPLTKSSVLTIATAVLETGYEIQP